MFFFKKGYFHKFVKSFKTSFIHPFCAVDNRCSEFGILLFIDGFDCIIDISFNKILECSKGMPHDWAEEIIVVFYDSK